MRISINNLLPNTDYAVQVRATSSNAISEWSRKFIFTTINDTVLPNFPTNVTWTSVGNSFHGEWDAVTTNENGDISTVVRYELELTAGALVRYQSVPQKTDGTKVTFDLPFEQNIAIFGSAKPSISLRVRAVDNKDLKSAWSVSVNALNPAPNPVTALSAAGTTDAISLTWTAPTDNDIVGYYVYVGAATGFTTTTTNRVTKSPISATNFTYNTATYSKQYFKVTAVDSFGQESTAVEANATAVSPFVVDITPPAVPSSLAAVISTDSFGRAKADVSWTLSAPSDLAGFNVRYRKVGDTNYLQTTVDKDSRTLTLELPVPYVNYEFQIRAFDWTANYSNWSATTTSTGSTNAAPAQVTGLTLATDQASLTASWTENTEDDVRNGAGTYQVDIATNSTFTTGLLTYKTGANSITVSGLSASTTYYVRVRAIDNVGQTGTYSVTSSKATTSFPLTPLTDGNAPSSSPTPTVAGGIGYLFVSWSPVTNADPVTYEVHLSTTSGFTPSGSTKVAEVSGTIATLEKDGAGTALAYGTTYYVKTIAKDKDGAAAASAQASGTIAKVTALDSSLTAGDVGAPTTTQFNTLTGTVNSSIKSYVTEYSVNSSETVAPTTGWSTATPTRTPGTFIWYRVTVTYNDNTTSTTSPALLTGNTGATGAQGIQGPAGADGQSLYTWIKYADTPTSGMSDSPTGKAYMGIAVNKTTATESTTYSDYTWSLTKGDQGVPGTTGADGVTTYTWVKYADNASGGGMSDDPTGKTYIGLAFNKTTQTESTIATDYTWSLIQGPQGPTGATGAPAATISLTSTAQVLTSPSGGGATNPTTSTVTGTAVNTTINTWQYSVDGAAFSATVPAGVSRTGNVVTITGSTMTARTIAVRMADANGVADTLTVAKVSDGATGATGSTGPTGATGSTGPAGADAYTVLLSNEAQTFAAGTTNALATTATTNVIAYKGTTPVVATVGTITGGATGITAAVTNNGTTSPLITFTVTTSLSTKNGTFTIPVTVDGITFNQIFTWSLALTGAQGATGSTGAAGAPAANIVLTSNAQVLAVPSTGGATTPTTATVTGSATNTTITTYTYSVDGGAFSSTVPTGVSRTGNVVTITGSTMTARTITVQMADANGIADTLTVAKVSDGATGATGSTGAAGADAYTVLLTNEAQVFPGSTTAALAGSATTSVIAYKGITAQTATIGTITGQVTGLTTAITNNGTTNATVTVTVTTSLTTKSGTLTIPITVGGQSFTKTFAWSVSYTGATGSTGSTGATGATGVSVTSITPYFAQVTTGAAAPAKPTTATPAAPWVATEPGYVDNTELYRTEKVLFSDSSFTYTSVSKVSAYTAAVNAVTAANGKNKIVYSAGVATGTTGFANGDIWYQLLSGAVIGFWIFNGTTWVAQTMNGVVLSSIDAGKITTGSLDAARIAAGSLSVGQVGTLQTTLDAKAGIDYVQSRSTDLVANGTGFLGNNYNFSWATYDGTDAPVGITGSFTTTSQTTRFNDEFIPIDPGKAYQQSIWLRQKVPGVSSNLYFGLAPYDAQKNVISPQHYVYQKDSDCALAVALNPGDTTITVDNLNATVWAVGTYNYVGIWNWADTAGRIWPVHTYTRNVPTYASISGNVITLSAPYAGPAMPVGTPITRNYPGGNYMYTTVVNAVVPQTWTQFVSAQPITGVFNGASTYTNGATFSFPPGCAFIKLLFLTNYNGANGGVQAYAGISFSDVSAAQTSATAANSKLAGWTYTGTTNINGGVIQTDTITAVQIAGKTITAAEIAANTITASSGIIANAAITNAMIANLAVNTAQIADLAVNNAKIADATIQSAKIANLTADKITSGTISAQTITMGASGKISLGVGGSITVDGSTGVIKSNNYAAGSTGWSLGYQGLEVNDGSINAKTITSGTISAATLTLSGANGKIVGTGFSLSGTGLTVTSGSIAAAAITVTSQFADSITAATTTIDGGKINTGSIQSNQTVTVNGVAQPLWSINTNGSAQFGNANVRGALVVGATDVNGNDLDNAASFIQSANYVPGTRGWIARSDGTAEFRGLAADSINGSVITARTITADRIAADAITANEIAASTITSNELAANSVTATNISATALDGKTITGTTIKTAASGQRWEMTSSPSNTFTAYTGLSNELTPGSIQVTQQVISGVVTAGYLKALGPKLQGTTNQATLSLYAIPSGSVVTPLTSAQLSADQIGLSASSGLISLSGGTTQITAGLNIDSTAANPAFGLNSIRQLNYGRVNLNTNSGSNLVFAHGLASKPSAVFWFDDSANSPYAGRYANGASDATNIVITMRRTDTNAAAASGISMQGAWLAIV